MKFIHRSNSFSTSDEINTEIKAIPEMYNNAHYISFYFLKTNSVD